MDIVVIINWQFPGQSPVWGRAMAQAVSRRPPTAEAQVRSRISPCGICGGQSGTGTGFSSGSSAVPCPFHSTGAPLLGKGQKIIIIFIFIVGLHNKPHGCSASVASPVGPFTTKKKVQCVLTLCAVRAYKYLSPSSAIQDGLMPETHVGIVPEGAWRRNT
jgi:hypothetical protein